MICGRIRWERVPREGMIEMADSDGTAQRIPPTNTTATISLIAGILGLTLLPFMGSIVAIITAYIARQEIRDSAGAQGGADLAMAGLVLGWIGVALSVIAICLIGVLLAIPFCLAFPVIKGELGLILPLALML
jgi:hypothetical protein